MDVLLYGGTGMVGQGVLRECLHAPDVTHVRSVGRSTLEQSHDKLDELVRDDLFDYAPVQDQLRGFDACFFCLGVSAAGLSEAQYARLTYDITMAAATLLSRLNRGMTFVYVSGAGTDSTERGGVMWARVKGRTENALLRLPFKATYMFRPGLIQPLHGIRSHTPLYRWTYTLSAPLLPLARWLAPTHVLTTEIVGRAMLEVARHGAPKALLHPPDIAALGRLLPSGERLTPQP